MWFGEWGRRGVGGLRPTWLSPSTSSSLVARLSLIILWVKLGAGEFHDYYNLSSDSINYWTAVITYAYVNPRNASSVLRGEGAGRFGYFSNKRSEEGVVIHVEVEDGINHGCTPYLNPKLPQDQSWIALVQRGDCKFHQKVHMAYLHNASAVVIYNHLPEDDLITMLHNETEIVTVFIGYEDGTTIAGLVDSGTRVVMNISLGIEIHLTTARPNMVNTAVLLTFVGLLIVALIIVVIYAVRHAKHVHAKHQARMNMSSGSQAVDHLLPIYTPNGREADVTIHNIAPQNSAT